MQGSQQEQQTGAILCSICFGNVQRNEPRSQCGPCGQIYHTGCIVDRLTRIRRDELQLQVQLQQTTIVCPSCREDMRGLLDNLLQSPCAHCNQLIGETSHALFCHICRQVYHENEISELTQALEAPNIQEPPWLCPYCQRALIPNHPGAQPIQSVQQDNNINIYDFYDDDATDMESESDIE